MLNFCRHFMPFFWNPITDMTSTMTSSVHSPCHKLELTALECIEYHGIRKGNSICSDHYDDFVECVYNNIQVKATNFL